MRLSHFCYMDAAERGVTSARAQDGAAHCLRDRL